MRSLSAWLGLATTLLLACLSSRLQVHAAVDSPIIIKGSKFFYQSNGTQFFVKGVYYTPLSHSQDTITGITSPEDILLDSNNACGRDVPYLQAVGTNVVAVAALQSGESHAQCMELFAGSDLYVTVDLSFGSEQIGSNPPTWTTDIYSSFTAIIDEMQQYDNVLAFYVASSVYTGSSVNNTANLAYVRAATRDLKSYMKQRGYRNIPIGYSAADDPIGLTQLAQYMDCVDEDSSSDFLGLQDYSWCDPSTLTESGYSQTIDQFRNYSNPVILSQYGCNINEPRTFGEVQALYSSIMTDVFSGATVFEYFDVSNNGNGSGSADFGLVSVSGGDVKTSDDYVNFSRQQAKATPSGMDMKEYTPSNTMPTTFPATNSYYFAIPTFPPKPYPQLCECMLSTLTCTLADQNTDSDTLNELFSTVCDPPSICDGIAANATTGTFGAYSMCTKAQQASWVLNVYSNAKQDCLGSLGGTVVKPSTTNSSCSGLLQQAGPAGTGTLTSYLAAVATTSRTSGTSATGSSGAGSTGTSSSSGLSTGAKAGIGVAAAIVGLAIIAGVVFFFIRRRQKQRKPQHEEKNGWGKSELSATEVSRKTGMVEPHMADSFTRSELPVKQVAPVELGGHEIRPANGPARPGGMGELTS